MSDNTKIEWADATVNAINGCTRVSPGCGGPGDHGGCYAERLAATRLRDHPSRPGLATMTSKGPRWTGKVYLHEPALLQPLSWTKPRRIFWNAHGDTFHDAVPDEWIDRIFAVAALTPQHTHMILTKRSKRMREYFTKVRVCDGVCDSMSIVWDVAQNMAIEHGLLDRYQPTIRVLPNVWLGVSVEDQTRADERIPDLLATPAAVRLLSCEPLLGPIDLMHVDVGAYMNRFTGREAHEYDPVCRWPLLKPFQHLQSGFTSPGIDWVIAGGESGPCARPMHPDWARSLRDQCAAAGVPFHFKQWGEWMSVYDRDRDDPEWNNVPKPGDWDRKRWLNLAGGQGFHGDKLNMMRKVGRKRAGRLLDGIEHNGMPGGQN